MVMQPDIRQSVIEYLERLAENDTPFTFSSVRERVGVDPRGDSRGALWSLWTLLREKGIVQELDTGQKRNRLYRVAQPQQLRTLVPGVIRRADEPQPHEPSSKQSSSESRLDRIEKIIEKMAVEVAEHAKILK